MPILTTQEIWPYLLQDLQEDFDIRRVYRHRVRFVAETLYDSDGPWVVVFRLCLYPEFRRANIDISILLQYSVLDKTKIYDKTQLADSQNFGDLPKILNNWNPPIKDLQVSYEDQLWDVIGFRPQYNIESARHLADMLGGELRVISDLYFSVTFAGGLKGEVEEGFELQFTYEGSPTVVYHKKPYHYEDFKKHMVFCRKIMDVLELYERVKKDLQLFPPDHKR